MGTYRFLAIRKSSITLMRRQAPYQGIQPVEITDLSISEAATLIGERKISPVELTRACLDRIERIDPKLNCFITLTAERALEEAHSAEAAIARGEYRGRLHGIPLAYKDLYETQGIRTTAGSKLLLDYVPDADCTAVAKLKAAGAICLGKLNLQQWALGVTNAESYFGPTHNPWDLNRMPGGSSGGSGAALSARLCFGSLGSDTGGSIRVPAALCGVAGLKPTFGRVSTRGVIPLSWSLDHAGPMARTVGDVALLLTHIAGYDAGDPNSANVPDHDFTEFLTAGVHDWRIVLVEDEFIATSDPEVLSAVREAAKVFETMGARVKEIDFSQARQIREVSRVILHSDAAAYHRQRLQDTPDDFMPSLVPRLRKGMEHTAVEYALARREQLRIKQEFEALFANYDLMLMPTTPKAACLFDDPEGLEMARFTAAINLIGVPALSVPCGFTQAGLPIGLQLIARHWDETRLLRAGNAYEQATKWYLRKPTL
jgi:aspartyl-tRNA(Asn)/glutamyl-tRNA(Gln) amidotransferase subunit A